jgi:hypothetical protein
VTRHGVLVAVIVLAVGFVVFCLVDLVRAEKVGDPLHGRGADHPVWRDPLSSGREGPPPEAAVSIPLVGCRS